MSANKNYYQILGVSRDAESIVIKMAYKALAQKYHPDKYSGHKAAQDKLKLINEAYQVLGNESSRKDAIIFLLKTARKLPLIFQVN